MNRYKIINKISNKSFSVIGETFPPDKRFHPEWGDPGKNKVEKHLATKEQEESSIGEYIVYKEYVDEDKGFSKKNFHYYVLSHELDVTVTNIDNEIAEKEKLKEDKKVAFDNFSSAKIDDKTKLDELAYIVKDIRDYLIK